MTRNPHLFGLDREQLGHLRHLDNMSRLLPNDWSLMGSRTPGQDDFASLRYQLGYSAIALALTHVHRLPGAPGVFRGTLDRLIQKMLLPEVWMYWRDTSSGRSVFNAHIPMESEWDPVRRDNIMYSAYLQVMALLYNYLFDDEKYAEPGSLTFRHHSFAWGGEEKIFRYDQNSLNELIYWKMVESGFIGVACEPNCVFQICNQIPLLGFRLHDLLTGGDRAESVSAGYAKAWDEFGRLDDNGGFKVLVTEQPQQMVLNESAEVWVDAWSGTVLNMLNPDLVRHAYPAQLRRSVVPGPEGTLTIRPLAGADILGNFVFEDHADFGWAATWAGEVGDLETRDRLLAYADQRLRPTWSDGGLYYPRHDEPDDSSGHHSMMDPLTGNVLLGYARLNVPDGLRSLYRTPLPEGHHRNPALTEVGHGVDVRKAYFDGQSRSLRFSMASCPQMSDTSVTLDRLGEGTGWVLERGNRIVARRGAAHTSTDDPAVSAIGNALAITAHPDFEEFTLHVL